MLPAFFNARRSVAFPLPGSDRVAENGFKQRAEGQFAVVAVREQDHARLLAFETNHIILRAVAVAFLKECGAKAGVRQQPPAHAISQSYRGTFRTLGLVQSCGELVKRA